jgi:hypothetical protein
MSLIGIPSKYAYYIGYSLPNRKKSYTKSTETKRVLKSGGCLDNKQYIEETTIKKGLASAKVCCSRPK